MTKYKHLCAFLPVTSAGGFLFAPVLGCQDALFGAIGTMCC